MPRIRSLAFGVAACGAVALAACSNDHNNFLKAPTPAGGAIFQSYVALGNSITAGYQSGGINDSTQRQSYAALLAAAMGTRYAYPSLAMPGCPPPVKNFQTQERVGTGVITSTTCFLRDPTSIAFALNNVAVPGATVIDPASTSTAFSNSLTFLFLGGKSQALKALDADPTFISLWLGNNDVLAAAVTGLLVPTAGVSPGITAVATFQTNYDNTIGVLTQARRLKGGVLIGVVNVANLPILFPAAALFNPAFKAGFDAFAGGPTTLLPTCTPLSTSLISFQLAPTIRSGAHPALIGCEKNSVPATAVGDIFVLDAAEQTTLGTTVASYNAYIQTKAASLGFAYFDPNPPLAAQKATGAIPTVPNLADPINPFGLLFSLDGVHPRRAAHVLVANGVIDAINAKYATTLARVQ
ncbi:MAG: SGNH/GDSL hydrolase family protein [Gemmatimonadaceae bacterium]